MNHPENLRWGYANPYLRKFLQTAYAEGLEQINSGSYKAQQRWQRAVWVGEEFLSSDLSLKEFSQEIGVSRERVRQRVFNYVSGLYGRGDDFLHMMFSWDMLKKSIRKPISIRHRENYSRWRGGKAIEFVELLKAGASIATAQELSGAGDKTVYVVRKNQKVWDVQVPYSQDPNRLDSLSADLGRFDDYDTVGYLIGFVDRSFLNNRDNRRDVVVNVSHVVAGAGFFGYIRHHQQFNDSLRHATIPVQEVQVGFQTKGNRTYLHRQYVISARHFEEAKQILLLDDTLKEFRGGAVQLLWGPKDTPIPTSTVISANQGYRGLGNLMLELGLIRGRSYTIRVGTVLIGEDCPVPVFRYGGRVSYPTNEEQLLREYLVKKAQK